jgi:hypothetical protein
MSGDFGNNPSQSQIDYADSPLSTSTIRCYQKKPMGIAQIRTTAMRPELGARRRDLKNQ